MHMQVIIDNNIYYLSPTRPDFNDIIHLKVRDDNRWNIIPDNDNNGTFIISYICDNDRHVYIIGYKLYFYFTNNISYATQFNVINDKIIQANNMCNEQYCMGIINSTGMSIISTEGYLGCFNILHNNPVMLVEHIGGKRAR